MPIVSDSSFILPWKILQLGARKLRIGMSACAGPGDRLVSRNGHLLARCRNGNARVLPPYRGFGEVRCGTEAIRLTITEITTQQDYDGYRQLLDFHYRGRATRGRHAILIATTRNPLFPRVLGYIELTTSFIMNKARAILFDAPFDSQTGTTWDRWNMDVARRHINAVVRIARCVVYPEFRGLGLGQVLVNHSFRFAKSHWHVGGIKPCFVEITADMLKFIPFAAKAGMVYIGQTEGNLRRVGNDLEYLLRNYSRISRGDIIRVKKGRSLSDPQGILDLQLGYARRMKATLKKRKISQKAFLRELDSVKSHLPLRTYSLVHEVLRFPKPTYVRGLTGASHRFLLQRVRELGITEPATSELSAPRPLRGPISFNSVAVSFSSSVRLTKKTQSIQQAFGLSLDHLDFTVIKDFSLQIPPGSIVLLYGASGSGKTILLELIARRGLPSRNMRVSGTISLPTHVRVGRLTPIASNRALIELFGGRSISRSINTLNTAGLSEAYLYLKRFNQLSRGQQYRALIAKMLESNANVWIADEFCASLDRVTANIVAANLRRHAKNVGATVVVACGEFSAFGNSLQPDILVQLTNAWEYKIFTGRRLQRLLAQ